MQSGENPKLARVARTGTQRTQACHAIHTGNTRATNARTRRGNRNRSANQLRDEQRSGRLIDKKQHNRRLAARGTVLVLARTRTRAYMGAASVKSTGAHARAPGGRRVGWGQQDARTFSPGPR
jgi:hypothetical protein